MTDPETIEAAAHEDSKEASENTLMVRFFELVATLGDHGIYFYGIYIYSTYFRECVGKTPVYPPSKEEGDCD